MAINVQSQTEGLCDSLSSARSLYFVDTTASNFVSPVTLCVCVGYIFGLSKYWKTKADE